MPSPNHHLPPPTTTTNQSSPIPIRLNNRLHHHSSPQSPQLPGPIPDSNPHPSAAAPRQSTAFKRLANANLVSSSVFKSAPSPLHPSNIRLQSNAIHSSSSTLSPNRPSGPQSPMASPSNALGLHHPIPPTSDSPSTISALPSTSPLLAKSRLKRKSDENLPIPPRPPPNLPPSVPPLQPLPNSRPPISPSSKSRPPPRQSTAFDSLSRNALVSSSPFRSTPKSTQPVQPRPLNDPASFEDDGEESSNESDLVPGTPPCTNTMPPANSPRPTGSSNGLLKTHRLAGPRSFTPPHSPRTTPSTQLPSDHHQHPPSALTTPGKRHERRKTVTWGGEDVLEFERDDDWQRSSQASSFDSSSASPNSSDQIQIDPSDPDSSSELDHDSGCRPPSPSNSDDRQSHEHQFWGRLPIPTGATNNPPNQGFRPPDRASLDSSEDNDMSAGSVVVHSSSEDSGGLAVPRDVDSDHRNSLSSETDPVDQMVNALLTSPDLAPHVGTSQSAQPLAAHETEHLAASDHPSAPSISRQDESMDHQAHDANGEPSAPSPHKPRSRFPYRKPEPDNDQPMETQSNGDIVENSILSDHAQPAPANELLTERAPFCPISLPGLGPEDSMSGEVSLISSLLESSTINVDSLNRIQVSDQSGALDPQQILSSTPRTSYSHQLPPPPDPLSPGFLADSALPGDDTLALALGSPGSPRRPLPRPPPLSAAPVSALNAPPDTLPDLASRSPFPGSTPAASAAVWRRPTLESGGSESDFGGSDSLMGSPSSTRPRITREKIMERMRERDRAGKGEAEEGLLTREPTSHSASIHKLGLDGEEELVQVEPVGTPMAVPVERLHEIQARPPLHPRAVTLSDTVLRTVDESGGCSTEDATVRQDLMEGPLSGLDRLAHGFQSSEDGGARSADSSGSGASLVGTNEIESGGSVLPSKLIRVKGVGRRRRSLSTGGADLEETGTGAGAKAAVRSASIIGKRLSGISSSSRTGTGMDKERAKVVSGLLHNTIQRAIEDSEFQAPLDRALKVISDADHKKSYNVIESEEVVIATDQHTLTIGVAGDVAGSSNSQQMNWRKLRKVSDINEYEKQIRMFWEKNENRDKIGKVFVKMSKLVFRGLPPSQRPAYFQVVIDNGLHTVKTAAYKLEEEVMVGVEFELVRARKLEFSLAFTVPLEDPRNAHLRPPRPATMRPVEQHVPAMVPSSPKLGFAAKLFGGNSKRHSKMMMQQQREQQDQLDRQRLAAAHPPPPHPLVALLDRNQTLATAVVNFEQHADESLGRWKQVVIPCMAAAVAEDPVKASMQMRPTVEGPVGQVCIEFLSLPPVPKVPNAVVPNSSAECLKGLRIAEWWQEVWHEGVLSQMGADCATWRRRTFKATGGSLFAYNDIMNKLSAEIRLAEVVGLEDCGGPSGETAGGPSYVLDQGEVLPGCTFRLRFKDGSAVLFHADSMAEYKQWKNVLGQLIGKIQQLPVWAELLRLQIAARRKAIEARDQDRGELGGEGVRTSRQPGRRTGGARMQVKGKSTSVASSSSKVSTVSEWSEDSARQTLSTIVSAGSLSASTASVGMGKGKGKALAGGSVSVASGSGSGSGSGNRYRLGEQRKIAGESGSGSSGGTNWGAGRLAKPASSAAGSSSSSSAGTGSLVAKPLFSAATGSGSSQQQQQQQPVRSGMKRSQGNVRL